jgi:hypothetical protein
LIHTQDSLLGPLLDGLLALMPLSTHNVLERKFEEDVRHLYADILEGQLVLQAYKKSKIMQINQIVKKGYFKNGINWRSRVATTTANASSSSSSSSSFSSLSRFPPLRSRSCVLELLLQFVLIHDELYTVRKELVDEVIESIVETVSLTLMATVRQIEMRQSTHTHTHTHGESGSDSRVFFSVRVDARSLQCATYGVRISCWWSWS